MKNEREGLIVVAKYRATNESLRPLQQSACISFEMFGYQT